VLPANNTNTFEIGEQLIVVGVPGRDKSRMVLRNASVRSIGHNQSPSPVGLSPDMTSDERLDCRLVHLSGTLSRMSSIGMDQLLEISWGDTPVVARLMGTATMKMPESWKTGSMVEITGIFRSVFDENRRRTGFEVLLRNIDDVAILRSPPWWTTERALGMAGGLAVFGAFAFLWVVFLRRRVAQQTSLIREQMVKETKLEGELERAQRLHALGTLAGGIAHDFNNLLTVVMGNITLAMLDSKVVELAGDTLREAETGTKRARDLTQQMLTFARGGDPVREHVQLRAIIEESVQFALSGTNVVADIQVPDDLWTAHADRSQLHSALTSLLQHARSSMPEGGAVSVESSNEAIDENDDRPLHPGRYVKIRIKDQGTPIPANRLSSIFDPYASVFTDGDRFGLASAYSIARKHGGLLAVEPGQERGTIFTLWIPSSTDAKPAENPTEPAADIPEFTPIAGSRVLFMDDEESIRRLAETVLGQLQCHCVTVADGSDCLRTYRVAKEQGQPFDLVILDLTVPGGMGGADTVKELRKFAPEAVAVVSSGYANDPILAHYQEYGFSGVVAKPYAVERFRDVVREILAKQRSTSA
jgi:signal transduction histidine kinase/ActR/RegA family two-component response regulator